MIYVTIDDTHHDFVFIEDIVMVRSAAENGDGVKSVVHTTHGPVVSQLSVEEIRARIDIKLGRVIN